MDGIYVCTGSVLWGDIATTYAKTLFGPYFEDVPNGAAYGPTGMVPTKNLDQANSLVLATPPFPIQAGYTIKVNVYQSTGGALNVIGGVTGDQSYLGIYRISSIPDGMLP